MNKRIQELAEEADCNIDGMGYGEGNLENFAKLIVRECADVARQADIDGCNIGNYAWEKIKEHFGVEQ